MSRPAIVLGSAFLFLVFAAPAFPQAKPAIQIIRQIPAVEETKAEPDLPLDPVKRDEALLKTAGVASSGEAMIDFLKNRSLPDADRLKLASLIRRLGSEDFDERESVAEEIVRMGMPAVGLLRQSERDADWEISRQSELILKRIEKIPLRSLTMSAVRLLALRKPPETARVLLRFLPTADDSSVVDEIHNTLVAVAMRDGKPEPALVEMLGEADPERRGIAAELLIRGGSPEVRIDLKKRLAVEKNPEVRFRIVTNLVSTGKMKDLIPEMIRLMGEVSQDRAWVAEELLCRLGGENVPPVSVSGAPEARRKAAGEWLTWWEKNSPGIDLAKLEETPALLGLTVLMQANNTGIGGRIIEVTADGTIKSKIDNLNYPIDCQFLPGGRILVAEHNGNQVTEREIATNKVLWTTNVQQPVSVQRLPNGNTLIAGRAVVTEVDRERKTVFTHPRPNYDIVSALKLRSGDYLYLTQAGQVIRIDKDGKVIKAINVGFANYIGTMTLVGTNRILVTNRMQVAEYDLDTGKPLDFKLAIRGPGSAQRLPNGNTLVSEQSMRRTVEYDRAGKEVWTYTEKDPVFVAWRALRR